MTLEYTQPYLNGIFSQRKIKLREIITSSKNEYIKKLKSLSTKKGRKSEGVFLAEGEKCVGELMSSAPQLLSSLIIVENAHEGLAAEAAKLGAEVYPVKEHVMNSFSSLKTSQGVAAVAKAPSYDPVFSGFILALDDVADPQNVGTMIRTADAAGCSGVALSENSADFMSPKAVRASMGSIFHIPVFYTELTAYLTSLKQNGHSIACADLGGSTDFKLDWQTTCLVIGNEARGISQSVKSLATDTISIPMYGEAESLNAAVAAGILVYKIRN